MERTRPSRRSRKNLGRLARVWRILLTPILHLLRKYREEYARRRRRVGRLVERVGEAVLAAAKASQGLLQEQDVLAAVRKVAVGQPAARG